MIDHAAPAMATTVMSKPASLKKDVKPRAAEAITKNAYVDDICKSVCTIEDAKKLTSGIDGWFPHQEIDVERSNQQRSTSDEPVIVSSNHDTGSWNYLDTQ